MVVFLNARFSLFHFEETCPHILKVLCLRHPLCHFSILDLFFYHHIKDLVFLSWQGFMKNRTINFFQFKVNLIKLYSVFHTWDFEFINIIFILALQNMLIFFWRKITGIEAWKILKVQLIANNTNIMCVNICIIICEDLRENNFEIV